MARDADVEARASSGSNIKVKLDISAEGAGKATRGEKLSPDQNYIPPDSRPLRIDDILVNPLTGSTHHVKDVSRTGWATFTTNIGLVQVPIKELVGTLLLLEE